MSKDKETKDELNKKEKCHQINKKKRVEDCY